MKYYAQIRNGQIEQARVIENGFTAISTDPELSIISTGTKATLLSLASCLGVKDLSLITVLI